MSTLTVSPSPWLTFNYANGSPVAQGQLYTYLAGTTTLQSTYSEVTGTTAQTNPIILDSAGRAAIYLLPTSYRFVLYDSVANGGALIRDQDNVAATPGTSAYPDVPATAGQALTAGQGVYLSDGSGAKVAGRWYLWDSANAYSSTLPELGMVVADIASGSTGTVRLVGQVTGLSALSAGTGYYVGTAGALTQTAPTLARSVGVADTTATLMFDPSDRNAVTTTAFADLGLLVANTVGGRLTLTTGVPIPTTDVTAATTLYYTPYTGTSIGLYNGTTWDRITFAEISIAIPATTAQVYDVFVYNNSGTAALELLAWTNDTTRATALVRQQGIWAKTGALTRRYVGSVRTTSVSGQTEDSLANRFLWNMDHRVDRPMARAETTPSWAYQTNTIRQANGSSANQLNFLRGLDEDAMAARVRVTVQNTGAGNFWAVGIALDSTTTFDSVSPVSQNQFSIGTVAPTTAEYQGYPGVGKHALMWNEVSTSSGTTTWYGTTNLGSLTSAAPVSGLTGMLRG